jgi:hypothetical protein
MLRVTARALARLRPPFPSLPIQTKPRATRRFQNPPAVSSTNPFFACTPPPSLPPPRPYLYAPIPSRFLLPASRSNWVGLGVRVGVVCTGVVARCFVLLVRKEERRGRGSKRGGRWRRSGSSRSSRTCRRILPPPAAQVVSVLHAQPLVLLPLYFFIFSFLKFPSWEISCALGHVRDAGLRA